MNRPFAIVACSLLFAGCASTAKPLPEPNGQLMGPGAHRFDVGTVADHEAVDEPWAPSAFYPGLTDTEPVVRAEHDAAISDALRASGRRPLASRSSSAGAAWILFQVYSNTWSRADGSTCRFAPTCSGFGRQAVSNHGLLGLVMTFGRLNRNHSDSEFYRAAGPRLADPLRLHDFWFREPDGEDREAHPEIDAYLKIREARGIELPKPPQGPQ